jgi:hypothetical protein
MASPCYDAGCAEMTLLMTGVTIPSVGENRDKIRIASQITRGPEHDVLHATMIDK